MFFPVSLAVLMQHMFHRQEVVLTLVLNTEDMFKINLEFGVLLLFLLMSIYIIAFPH